MKHICLKYSLPVLLLFNFIVSLSADNHTERFKDNTISICNNGDTLVCIAPHKYEFGRVRAINETKRRSSASTRSLRRRIASVDTTYSVGEIPHSTSVSPLGARVISIPVQCGASCFAPQISLSYNSQAADGSPGYGWMIGGLHSITLGNAAPYYHDSFKAASISDTSSVFFLDGEPIVSNDIAPQVPTYKYMTARSQVLISRHDFSESGVPQYFSALYPDGTRATFGWNNSATPSVSFPITQLKDRFGNTISFSYNSSDGIYDISSIRFGSGTNYQNALTFSYSPRNGAPLQYFAGTSSRRTRLLRSVSSIASGDTLVVYELTHDYSDGVPLVSQIGCRNDIGQRLPPLRFTYDYEEEGYISDDFYQSSTLITDIAFSSSTNLIYKRAKLSSSRFSDGLVIYPYFPTYDGVEYRNVLGKKYYRYGSKYPSSQTILVQIQGPYGLNIIDSLKCGNGFQTLEPLDVDADGTDELVRVNFNGTTGSNTILSFTVYKFNDSSLRIESRSSFSVSVPGTIVESPPLFADMVSPVQMQYFFGDFNGSCSTQLLAMSYNIAPNGSSRVSQASLIDLQTGALLGSSTGFNLSMEEAGKVFSVDLDNDGRTDLLRCLSSGTELYSVGNNALATVGKNLQWPISSYLDTSYDTFFTDLNSDGYIDIAICMAEGSDIWMLLSYDGEEIVRTFFRLATTSSGDKFIFLDIDKNGFPDLVRVNGTALSFYLNNNGTLSSSPVLSSLALSATADLPGLSMQNIYGACDFLTAEGHDIRLYSFGTNHRRGRLLSSIIDSYGNIESNNYSDISDPWSGCYLVDTTRAYSHSNLNYS